MIMRNCEFKKAHIDNPSSQKVDECLSLLTFGKIYNFKLKFGELSL